jgi:hypothetical protein
VTDKEKKIIIIDRVNYWIQRMKLQHYEFYYRWHKKLNKVDKQRVAQVVPNTDYLRAVLHFILPALDNMTMKEIYDYVAHELVHVIMARYDWLIEEFAIGYPEALFTQIKENTVETITRIILEASK